MLDLPVMGREFPSLGYRHGKVFYHGLVEVRCSNCGYSVWTFRKSVHRANSIVCPECGAIYKEALNSIRVQKAYMQQKVVFGRNNRKLKSEVDVQQVDYKAFLGHPWKEEHEKNM